MRALFLVLLILLIAGVAFIYSGMYNVGADKPHWTVTAQALATLRERSIAQAATNIAVPSDLDSDARIREGAHHYAQMCAACHLTPGMRSTELRQGLYPQPPDLAKLGTDRPAEAFWVIKHGVKLTAMPAWGVSHNDDAIWDMVAFIRKLPELDENAFVSLAGTHGDDGHGGGHHHDDGHDDHDEHDGHMDMPATPASASSTH
ncbi:cytochrome c [Dyella sp.]|uniref:c-type cytochrome n=1 Tax=Dyella sp. TaxID=1869338 RepID=UPI002ED4FF13